MDQPTPQVSRHDVERVVRRDFPATAYTDVISVLDEYGTADHHRERERVQLAVLKLANGSKEMLRQAVEDAKCDYRDVLSPAEYPDYPWDADELPADEQRKIIEADWQQYSDWLTK